MRRQALAAIADQRVGGFFLRFDDYGLEPLFAGARVGNADNDRLRDCGVFGQYLFDLEWIDLVACDLDQELQAALDVEAPVRSDATEIPRVEAAVADGRGVGRRGVEVSLGDPGSADDNFAVLGAERILGRFDAEFDAFDRRPYRVLGRIEVVARVDGDGQAFG